MKIIFTAILLAIFSVMISAQTKVVPIVDMKIGGLLGGVQNGKFLDAQTTVQKLVAEQNYTLYLFDGTNEKLKLKKPIATMDVCQDFLAVDMDQTEYTTNVYEKGGVALGEGFSWNPQPRASKAIDLNNAQYKKIVTDFLRTKRITQPNLLKLKQAVRVDLDGDGKEEVVLTASRIVEYEDRKKNVKYDEYSVVLIRKIVGKVTQNILLDGNFYPKNPYEYDSYNYTVSSIADLNGDGKMEIVLHAQFYEGSATQVYEMVGNKAVEVKKLAAECGV